MNGTGAASRRHSGGAGVAGGVAVCGGAEVVAGGAVDGRSPLRAAITSWATAAIPAASGWYGAPSRSERWKRRVHGVADQA